MFADFFGRIADTPLAVLEVECRSMGAPRCRFLVGNAEVMEHVYEEMGRGVDYEEAVGSCSNRSWSLDARAGSWRRLGCRSSSGVQRSSDRRQRPARA